MISYVDTVPTVESTGNGFLVTFKSGNSETACFLTLHAMTGLCSKGMLSVNEAQAKAAIFEPTPLKPKQRGR